MPASVLEAFDAWYGGLRTYERTKSPSRGTINAALVVLERLKEDCNLHLDSHRVPGGAQIQGAVGEMAAKILARYGETRPFVSQAPAGNRRGPGEIARMLSVLDEFHVCRLPTDLRVQLLEGLQEYLVIKVQEWHARQAVRAAPL